MKFSNVFAVLALTATAANALPNPTANAEAVAVPNDAFANIEARGLSQTVVAQITATLQAIIADLQSPVADVGKDITALLNAVGTLGAALFGKSS